MNIKNLVSSQYRPAQDPAHATLALFLLFELAVSFEARIVVDSRGDAFRGRGGLRLCTGREEEATVSRFKLMLALSMEDPVGINKVAAFAGVVVGLSMKLQK